MKTKTKISGDSIRSVTVAVVVLSALITLASAFNLPNRSPSPWSPLIFPGSAEKPATQTKTLTFADRVAYQLGYTDLTRGRGLLQVPPLRQQVANDFADEEGIALSYPLDSS